jgi:hypothetical protein
MPASRKPSKDNTATNNLSNPYDILHDLEEPPPTFRKPSTPQKPPDSHQDPQPCIEGRDGESEDSILDQQELDERVV